MDRPGSTHRERGQAAVEAALTLPIAVFLTLGTIQLFTTLQARALAQYAVARATRAGSVRHAQCTPMIHTAVAALTPAIARTRTAGELAEAFEKRQSGRFFPAEDGGHDEALVWLKRTSPDARPDEEEVFDLVFDRTPMTLQMRMVFWFPLRIPFANWVFSVIARARFGLDDVGQANPLVLSEKDPRWREDGQIDGAIGRELQDRARRRHWVMPIVVTYAMRMMTPARPEAGACSPTPGDW